MRTLQAEELAHLGNTTIATMHKYLEDLDMKNKELQDKSNALSSEQQQLHELVNKLVGIKLGLEGSLEKE